MSQNILLGLEDSSDTSGEEACLDTVNTFVANLPRMSLTVVIRQSYTSIFNHVAIHINKYTSTACIESEM